MKNKVLITGSNGLLGQSLLKLLKNDESVNIYATGRGEDRFLENGYTYHDVDLTNGDEIHQLIADVKPDVIIHSAAMSRVEDCEDYPDLAVKVNTEATDILSDAAIQNNVQHFLFISTDFVFSGDQGMYKEEDERNPPNFYGQTKLRAENLLFDKTDQLKISIIRTCLVYGQVKDMSRSNIMLWGRKMLSEGMEIKVVNDQIRTPTFVDDLAQGVIQCFKTRSEGVYHLSGAEVFTPYKMVEIMADEYKLDKKLMTAVNASTFKEHGKRPLKTGFIIDKAKQGFNYQTTTFIEAMKKVLS
ncbi:sugar nucleotide-binding protein [Flammeovirga yaeyamensis]|uniref:dTDP-4-dehydrorhamnose reductase n=1 Tax=Flammeovirga yaeyamensis TaxID=367791 RepID=A0AAX1N401_9BACT|nr:SDR family oxidoreductase [Flammeovirga yaeyamensis]MBB3698547.1 dTDP-4-dehydrorhamnose reductase [Flammeovirga yaeyamensis]NMF34104.1 SDR family oxidoreductase [Flammeovirga yaeyamensis]QWG01091.1 sugar nucleotide-binding protein [Flammeovirga yaeyamensis]